MHINRISKKVKCSIIAGLLIFTSTLGMMTGCRFQQNKINDLQDQLKMKQDIDHKTQGNYSTLMDAKTIQNKFNELNSYKVFDGSMVLKHKYEYQRDSFLGLKSRGVLVANARAYYEFKVDLKDAIVTVDNNIVNIELPRVKLDKNSVHMANETFREVEKESKNNLLMNDKDGEKLMRYFIESFNTSAIDKLEEYYDSGVMRDKLEDYAKREVRSLIDSLGLNRTDVKINIK